MKELFAQKVEQAQKGDSSQEGMDIMGALVRSSYGDSALAQKKKQGGDAQLLSDSDIRGNAFVMLLAGHETTANALHFSLVEVAIRPRFQRLMHKEIESIFGDTPPEQWDYESSINSLLGSVIGAVFNEQLRVMPPVVQIPKSVTKDQDQVIEIDGRMVTLPKNAAIMICTVSSHRNPRSWPSRPSPITGKENDLDDFNPERWLEQGVPNTNTENANDSTDLDEFGGFTGHSSSARLFRPVRGSYLPSRMELGRVWDGGWPRWRSWLSLR